MAADKSVALVTGASQGIGRQIALELGRRGSVLGLIDLQPLAGVCSALEALGAEAMELPGDVSDENTVERIVNGAMDAYGRIDVLVNNAGISFQRPAEETSLADWRRVLDVNLTGPFLLCREVGKHMLAQGSGSIINVSSIAGLLGFSDRVAYNTSKHGLIGLTRTLAVEWGGRGVRVNAICPGWVKTEMDERDQSRAGYTDTDITNRIPMARFALPDDIAQAVAFLAGPQQSAFVNGQCIAVDGGWSADGSWETLRLGHR